MKIKIGTRKSKLAVAQTDMAAEKIRKAFPNIEIEIVHISTKGDLVLDKPIADIGGRGVFVSEIEKALLDKTIDIAVHSAKDLPVKLADGLEISGVLERGNYRDVLAVKKGVTINKTDSCKIGTGSIRRRINFKNIYPNAEFENIRGNVDTRLEKLYNAEYDGIILAAAGLERLGLINSEKFDFIPFDYKEFLPAPCQGIIAVEGRKNDFTENIINEISDKNTLYSFETERLVSRKLNADCGMPLGVYSFVKDSKITIAISKNGINRVEKTEDFKNRLSLAEELILCL